jgi:hypothetical protein
MNICPEVHAFVMWIDWRAYLHRAPVEDVDFQMQDEPETQEGEAFRRFVVRNPDYFHSCVRFSDGSMVANCDEGLGNRN